MVNHFLRNSVTVTLQWPREAGAVYHVNIMPEAPHTELTNHDNNVVINLTISYNIQYNVSIVAISLCGVTIATTKILKYGRYENDSEIIYIHVPGDSTLPNLIYNIAGMEKLGRASMRMRLDDNILSLQLLVINQCN